MSDSEIMTILLMFHLGCNDTLKNTEKLVHSRHRSINNFIMNLVAAMGAYRFYDNKPKALGGYEIETSGQLFVF